jgi:hypothetical protein
VLAPDTVDIISGQTQRKCVFCIDDVQGCRLAVHVAVYKVS